MILPAPTGRPSGPSAGFFLAAALSVLALAPPAAAQERFRRTPPLPDAGRMEFKLPTVETLVLPNGLVVATVRRPESSVITLQLVIRAGEADSPSDRPGLAAVTAHMMGKGTKLFSADYIENLVESLGAQFSVNVFMDYTVLTIQVLEEYLVRAIRILRLMVLDATFTERELGAVRRTAFWGLYEKKKDPEVLGWLQLLRALFENHPYRIATYNEEVIKFIAPRDVASFYARFYRPGNAAVLVSGNIDGAAVAQMIGSHFGGWSGSPEERVDVPPPAPNNRERLCYVEAPDLAAATIFAGNVVMASSDPDFFPFLVLKQVLGGTTRSRLFMSLRESKGYATYAFSETEFFRTCGVYWTRALVRPEFIAPAVREIVREVGALAADAPAVPSEIEEAKSYLIGNLPMRFESLEGFADWMARHIALGLDQAQWDKGPEQLKLVDVERARETAKRYLSGRPLVVIVGRPEWLGSISRDFDAIEVYNTAGELKHILRKGEGQ